ncbi:hypothetical protein Gocc_2888 [Gaiella occulta]|uniref:Uncharacterized protein n=1 Tax=Gaiella occulta TaxID=1002870 RepID=A0A7M2YV41_9ACTN|nr:hypothetical protein [Gaiella occulta]RDI73288.1 hypothetical protein Gocc_2888 [Gaiella occulta]
MALVRVDQLRPGDTITLPRGSRVVIDRIDTFDGQLVVRWWRRQARYHDGWHTGDGRVLGSIVPLPAEAIVERTAVNLDPEPVLA